MTTEIEAKWLDVNHSELRTTLKKAGAKLIHAERMMVRKNFDFPDNRLDKVNGWVRVRSEGDKVTLSYKQLYNRTLVGTKEVSVEVSDFDDTCSFLESVGLQSKSYQETKRESWKIGAVEVELDTWPWIPSFVEIEAPDEAALRDVAEQLGLDYKNALHGSVEVAYQAVYDVTEEEIDYWKEIVFSEVPGWLEEKRINS